MKNKFVISETTLFEASRHLRRIKTIVKHTTRDLRLFKTGLFETSRDLGKSPASCGKPPESSEGLF
jgi:hypothetical protein